MSKGKKVLDLACGGGNFTRKIKLKGADEVVGIDLSKEMIKIARSEEKKHPMQIKYRLGKVGELGIIGQFDFVVGGFLLHYSATKKELLSMCKDVYNNLASEGKFIAINNNPEAKLLSDNKYGVTVSGKLPLKEGSKLTIKLWVNKMEVCSFTNYYWSKLTYETALKKAGFKKIIWYRMHVSSQGIKKFGKNFWNEFEKNPYLVIIEAIK